MTIPSDAVIEKEIAAQIQDILGIISLSTTENYRDAVSLNVRIAYKTAWIRCAGKLSEKRSNKCDDSKTTNKRRD